MTLTFTLGAGIIIDDEGREGARELLIALIGCDIAWGVIDGALYLVGQLFDRGRLRRLGTGRSRGTGRRLPRGRGGWRARRVLEGVTSVDEREALYARIAANVRYEPPRPNPSPRPTSRAPSRASGWS